MRLKAENLNERARSLAEMQARINHLRIVEHHQFACGKAFGQVAKPPFAHHALLIGQQFRLVALRQRVFGNTFFGKRIAIFFNAYMLRVQHSQYICIIVTNEKARCSHKRVIQAGQKYEKIMAHPKALQNIPLKISSYQKEPVSLHPNLKADVADKHQERCSSGLRGTPGKRVYAKSVSGVRIPLSPPKSA